MKLKMTRRRKAALLIVVVAALSSLAILLIHVNEQHRRDATLAQFQRIEGAASAYGTDWCGYPFAVSIAGLRRKLSPLYVRDFPLEDRWGRRTRYSMIVADAEYACVMRLALISAGPDGLFGEYGRRAQKRNASNNDDVTLISPAAQNSDSKGENDWWFPDDLIGEYETLETTADATGGVRLRLQRDETCSYRNTRGELTACTWDISFDFPDGWWIDVRDPASTVVCAKFAVLLEPGPQKLKGSDAVLVMRR